MCKWNTKREKIEQKKIYEVIMAKSFSKLTMTIRQSSNRFRKPREHQERYIANKPHLGISY